MKQGILRVLIVLAVLTGFSFTAASPTPSQSGPVRVGSKPFAENIILAKMILLTLKNAGIPIEDHTSLGNSDVNRQALLAGQIDAYPEYTGTAITNFFLGTDWVTIPTEAIHDAYKSFVTVNNLDAAINDLVWLQPAPANNTFAIVITEDFSTANHMTTMSDFADYVDSGGEVMLAANEDFVNRPDALPAFETYYGFTLERSQILVITGAPPAMTEQGLAQGVNGINASMAYSTDGALSAYNFVVLSDDLNAQPIYQPAPVFRGEVIRAYPQIPQLLNPIFASLDDATLRGLNLRVDVNGEDAEAVALDYLTTKGFIPLPEEG